jgi:hypothetical protein
MGRHALSYTVFAIGICNNFGLINRLKAALALTVAKRKFVRRGPMPYCCYSVANFVDA